MCLFRSELAAEYFKMLSQLLNFEYVCKLNLTLYACTRIVRSIIILSTLISPQNYIHAICHMLFCYVVKIQGFDNKNAFYNHNNVE